MRYLLSILGLFISLCLINHASAYSCTAIENAFIRLQLPASLPVSSAIANGDLIGVYSGTKSEFARCSDLRGITSQSIQLTTNSSVAGVSNDGYTIMKSNISGIGFVFGGISPECGGEEWMSGSTKKLCENKSGALPNASSVFFQPQVRLYKIGDIESSNQILTIGKVALVTNSSTTKPINVQVPEMIFQVHSCMVNSGNVINVNMESVKESEFDYAIGSVAGRLANFNIKVMCNKNSEVYLTIAGSSSNNLKGLLDLSTTATARGVAIQILRDGSPFPLNTKTKIGLLTTNIESSIELQARYYKIATITAGLVQAQATFSLQYN